MNGIIGRVGPEMRRLTERQKRLRPAGIGAVLTYSTLSRGTRLINAADWLRWTTGLALRFSPRATTTHSLRASSTGS